ncbi:unnamed protein product [Bathycoccus prasinos]
MLSYVHLMRYHGAFSYVIHFYRYLALATPTWRVEKYPKPSEINVFKIPVGANQAGKIIKLNKGTWHAGPFFNEKYMDFINFELRDTNISDHNSHDYSKDDIMFIIQDKE